MKAEMPEVEKVKTMPTEARKAKAALVSASRLLTQEDFKKIQLAQIAKEVDPAPGKSQKRKIEDSSDDKSKGELLSLRDIERLHKKPKSDKETRLATAMLTYNRQNTLTAVNGNDLYISLAFSPWSNGG
ncbi:protein SDA1 homolog isoform X3 [Mobula birostris]|uniref:protein SDA1 homolog isoform X3 n=1 Tax=Mobula birostris TaxID=1983395 RepID=UPI003B27D541